MSKDLILAHYKTLLPPGSLWEIDDEGDLHKLYEGIAECYEEVYNFVKQLAVARNPLETPFLYDLERDMGVTTDFSLTELERREQLASSEYNRTENGGTAQNLEELLRNAGFDVYVHKNNPPIDPALFPGDILLNGDIISITVGYLTVCGNQNAVCGNSDAVCARFDDVIETPLIYVLPIDPITWPFIFFVGGPATRDPGTGELTAIAPADVPMNRKDQFKKFILQTKPEETWAILRVNYV